MAEIYPTYVFLLYSARLSKQKIRIWINDCWQKQICRADLLVRYMYLHMSRVLNEKVRGHAF